MMRSEKVRESGRCLEDSPDGDVIAAGEKRISSGRSKLEFISLLRDSGVKIKLSAGFAVIIVLLCMVAALGVRGMKMASSHFELVSSMSRMHGFLDNARLYEKEFIIGKSEEDKERVSENIRQLLAVAEQVNGTFHSSEVGDIVKSVSDGAKKYMAAFEVYASLEADKNLKMEEMESRSEKALRVCQTIAGGQKALLESGRVENSTTLKAVQEMAESANNIIRLTLTARAAEKSFMQSGDKNLISLIRESAGSIITIAEKMNEKSEDKESLSKIRSITESAGNYIKAFERYATLKETQSAGMQDMGSHFGAIEFNLSSITQDITYTLDQLRKDSKVESDIYRKKMKMIAIADEISKWLWSARVDELNFEINCGGGGGKDGGEDLALNVEDVLGVMKDALNELKAGLDNQLMIEAADNAIKAVDLYLNSFVQYRERETERRAAEEIMLKQATSLQQIASSIKESQEKFLTKIESANTFMLDDRFSKSDAANTIMKLFLSARKSEKDFVITGGNAEDVDSAKARGDVERGLRSILDIAERLGGGFKEDEDGKKEVVNLLDAIKSYSESFGNFVDSTIRQKQAQKEMISAANEASKECDEASEQQNLIMNSQMKNSTLLITLFSFVAVAAGVLLSLLTARFIVVPIKRVVSGLTELSQGDGDLTLRLPVLNRDEIGMLSLKFNDFMERLHGLVSGIASVTEMLSGSSNDLSAISAKMADISVETKLKSEALTSGAEAMRSDMSSVSGAVEEASNSAGSVASSSEEMSASIVEISGNTANAGVITEDAVHRITYAAGRMEELDRIALSISQVTDTIAEISGQTNLLALNATIEAARAGESGRGFAVVANEIRELAEQTSGATRSIRKQIEDVQHTSKEAVSEVKGVVRVIEKVNEIVTGFAAAVEEQSVTTRNIADNIAYISSGISDVNRSVASSTMLAETMASDTSLVNESANSMAISSSQVQISAEELLNLSGRLREMVGQFRL